MCPPESGRLIIIFFTLFQVPFDTILKQHSSKEVGVLLGKTIPLGCGTAWIIARKQHPFMELVTKRLLAEYRW